MTIKRKIAHYYWDTAASTPVDLRVFAEMSPYLGGAPPAEALAKAGNPSSIHQEGVLAQKAMEEARAKIAKVLFAHPDEIIFTSGGTEGNNLAIFGLSQGQTLNPKKGLALKLLTPHIITSAIEHKAVLGPCRELENGGFSVTYLPVDAKGLVDLSELKMALTPETFLVSIIYASNEIGAVQPIKEITKIIRHFRKEHGLPFPYFHIDACQTPRFLNLNVEQLGVDLMTLNGSKIYGPKGIGCLFVRRGTKINPIIFGGGQEKGLRSGTQNVPGIVGLAKALEICAEEKNNESARLTKIQDKLISELKKISAVNINSFGSASSAKNASVNSRQSRVSSVSHSHLANMVNFSIDGLEGEQMVLELDAKGFAVSSGSACALGGDEGSYVIRALGFGKERAVGAVRVSLPRDAKMGDVSEFVKALKSILKKYGK